MAKTKKKLPAKPKNPDAVTIHGKPGDDPEAAIAQAYLRPTVQAGSTVRAYNKGADGSGPNVNALIADLEKQTGDVSNGDLRRAEAMLVAQAHSLDAIFGNLARCAVVQEYLPQYQAHLQLALKAQAQCRATLETLALIKNPKPVAFVRQANIGENVQVNNGAMPNVPRARENGNEQNKLLEHNGERLDFGTTSATVADHSQLAALGKINRAKNEAR